MRILHCIPSMGGGGAERQLAGLAEWLVREGLKVHVAHLHDGPNSEKLAKSGAEIHRLRFRTHYDPGILLQILRLARSVRPDLIHTWIPQMDVLGGIAAQWSKVAFVLSERSSALNYPDDWKMRLRLRAGRRAALVIANSEGGRSYWISRGMPADRVRLIRNGIPFAEIENASPDLPEGLEGDPGAEWVVFAGRYSPEKNLLNLMTAMNAVLAGNPRAVALFFGDGPLNDRLASLQRRSGFGRRLRVLGYTTRLWSILKRARLFVTVSFHEGSPNAVLEAAACGCPILVSDIPAHRELLDPGSAYFVPADSPSAIADGISRALADPEDAARKRDAARRTVLALSFEAMASEYARSYAEILDRRPVDR